MNILIAEDDPVSCRLLERRLITWGYDVFVTKNGREAWESLQREDSPSLAILDVMMPELDGLEVCRLVRKSQSSTPPYLILLTSMGSKDDVVNGIQAGANDYLTKPFNHDELKVRVGVGVKMVELQRTLRERVNELEVALAEVKQLHGLLPICSYCKHVRDDQNYWHKVESFISAHSDVQFSHGICPDCSERLAVEIEERKQQDLQTAR